jgi:hypothetical protein
MIYWNRFISYIYRYHGNEKCENAGFIKVQKNGSTARITIGMKDIMHKEDKTYDVLIYRETLAEDEETDHMIPKSLQIGKIHIKSGRGDANLALDWDNVKGSAKPMTAWNGIIIKNPRGGDYFCTSWTDNYVDYEKEVREETEEALVAIAEAPEKEKHQQINETATNETVMEQLMAKGERLPSLDGEKENTGYMECVKISPNDIGLMDMSNWHLGINSFLTHGYYNYKYLLLGRVAFDRRTGDVAYMLGVPGVYTAKEKYLANMFGFDRFVPVKRNTYKTGSFGYWIIGLKG